jgi:phosphoglycolate phosphatase
VQHTVERPRSGDGCGGVAERLGVPSLLAFLGLEPDAVIGNLWAEQKGVALREHGARVYVGDHTGDVRGVRIAEALSVAVPTGPCTAEELTGAGADVVLADLTEFPGWFSDYRPGYLPARA